jgi:hypothetical protein
MALDGLVPQEDLAVLEKEGLEIIIEKPIDEIWDRVGRNRWELSKVRIWRHTEYDRVILLDADCFFKLHEKRPKLEQFNYKPFSAPKGGNFAPLHAAKFLLQPSAEIYEDLVNLILHNDFSPKAGWRNYGPCPEWHGEGFRDWKWFSAPATQGLFYYYFKLLHNELNHNGFPHIQHIGCGFKKWKMWERPHNCEAKAAFEAVCLEYTGQKRLPIETPPEDRPKSTARRLRTKWREGIHQSI